MHLSGDVDGFALTEVPTSTPVTKTHEFLADLTDPRRPWTDGYVAVEGGAPVGFAATVCYPWNRRQVLWHLYVDHGYRGRGTGRALVEHVLKVAAANGARRLWLETRNTNTPAVAAYRAMGVQPVGPDTALYDGNSAHEAALYLAKPLCPVG